MSNFWKAWLRVWCGAVILFGIVLMGGAFAATDGPSGLLFLVMGGVRPEFDPALRFAVGLMGAVTFGWGLTFVAAIEAAHRLGAAGRPVWRMLAGVAIAWFAVDSSISIATGFALNAVSNTVFLAAFMLPVLRSGALRDVEPALSAR